MVYTVVIAASARKEIRALSREMQERVREAILSLATDPRPLGYIKLHGREGYR
jgi:mRNA interferase RelE/StbE